MSSGRFFHRQLAAGVVLGLALGLALVSWLATAERREAGAAAAEQAAVVTLSALADLVSATHAVGGDLQQTVTSFAAGHDDVVWARVIDFRQRWLLASTAAADRTAGPLPRPFDRRREDFKHWCDLGQGLSTAVATNRREARPWKEEIHVERRAGGHLQMAAPLQYGGNVLGVVVMEAAGAPPDLGGAPSPWLFLVAGAAAFLAAGRALRGRPWLAAAAAAVVVTATLGAFAYAALGGLAAARQAGEDQVASRLVAEVERTKAFDRVARALRPRGWDVDRFRRPRGLVAIDDDGAAAVDRAAVEASSAAVRSRFRRTSLWIGLASLGLAAFVGLGGARAIFRTVVRHDEAYSLVAPAMAGVLLLVLFPLLYGFTLSFTNRTRHNLEAPISDVWVGFHNYVEILTDFEAGTGHEGFYRTLGFTLAFTAASVAASVAAGLLLALALNARGLACRPLYRLLLILPWAVPSYVTALAFRGMLHPGLGTVNRLLAVLGGAPVAWFDGALTAFCALVAANVWLSFPFLMLVALSGLESIPEDLDAAARIDGAGRWQRLAHVTWPWLAPAMVPAILLSALWSFNSFNLVYLLSGGAPAHATEILVTRAFKLFSEEYRYGYAAAYSTVVFALWLLHGAWRRRPARARERF